MNHTDFPSRFRDSSDDLEELKELAGNAAESGKRVRDQKIPYSERLRQHFLDQKLYKESK